MNDLTDKCQQVEQTCDNLARENKEILKENRMTEDKMNSMNDKHIGQDRIIEQLQEQITDLNSHNRRLNDKLTSCESERTELKHTINGLEVENSRLRQEFYENSEQIKKKYEKRVIELEGSIKILTKCIEGHEKRHSSETVLREKLKSTMHQLNTVIKEKDMLRKQLEHNQKVLLNESFNHK